MGSLDKNKRKNLFETANGRSVGSLAFTRSIRSVSFLEFNDELVFRLEWKDHLKDADLSSD